MARRRIGRRCMGLADAAEPAAPGRWRRPPGGQAAAGCYRGWPVLDDEVREVNRCNRQAGRRGLFLLFLLLRCVGGRGFFGLFRLFFVDLEAQRPHGGVKDGLGQLLFALAGQQLGCGPVRQHHEDVVADGRHVDLQLLAHLGVVDLQRDADLGVALAVLVGQVDGERVQRHKGGRVFGVVHPGVGLTGLMGLGPGGAGFSAVFAVDRLLLHQHKGGACAAQHHHQHGGNEDDQLFLAGFGGRGGVGGSSGGGGHTELLGVGGDRAPTATGETTTPLFKPAPAGDAANSAAKGRDLRPVRPGLALSLGGACTVLAPC